MVGNYQINADAELVPMTTSPVLLPRWCSVRAGSGRKNDRWVLFRSHYGFDPFYCQPGIAGAHEKGGVEGEVGWFRRNRLSPMPVTESLDELNDRIRVWEA